jgi:hypothetical protein
MTKRIPDLSKCLYRGWSKDEIEDYIHDESEKEHYKELAEQAAWIGGE